MGCGTSVARCLALSAVIVAAAVWQSSAARAQSVRPPWVGTWATAVVGRPQTPPPVLPATGQTAAVPAPFVHFSNQTLRQVVRVSLGGSRVRAVVSNAAGTAPLTVGAVSLALRGEGAAIVPGSARPLTFSGRPAATIPAGASLVSDPADLTVPALADVVIDVFLPESTDTPSPLTMHNGALQTNYVSQPGNHAGVASFPVASTIQNWFLLARLEVAAPAAGGAVVTIGASLTDGSRSTPDTNNRWPNHLARRLVNAPRPMSVLDLGIGGNRLLSESTFQAGRPGLTRFDRDVVAQTGATHVIVADMALNDLGSARENALPSADDLIAAQKQVIARAHAAGLRVYGATLTPFEGAGYFTEVGETKRLAINRWIRTSGAYDAVIDFDQITRDPKQPRRFLPRYDSGDHLHPNDEGYRAMGEAIDLKLFRPAAATH
jgi:lysophospholipase L1-like esterase